MQIQYLDKKKYKRFFAFGCSYTEYFWPTWPDIIGQEIPYYENWDGEVYRATCRVGGSLGNIYAGTFTLPTDPIICTRDNCTCAADIPLTKENINANSILRQKEI